MTLLAAVLLTSVLVSCGGKTKPAEDATQAATEPTTEQVCDKACCGCEGCLCEDQSNCPECCPEGCPCGENCGKCKEGNKEACAADGECCKEGKKECADKGECCKEEEAKKAA